MEETYRTALTLLAVGMITVFSVLFLVVLLGRLLVAVVNRFFPGTAAVSPAVELPGQKNTAIDGRKVAAITAAVAHITGGRGRVTKIERKNK